MTFDSSNTNFKLAFDFINNTNCPLYLTGKAGTGKTTFLRHVKTHCTKNLVVVAPTGVAAINAGGVTIHSFFQLPFGPYIPDAQTGFGMNEGVVDKHSLFKNIKLNGTKRKLIDELELLIIDEVSMLRSDMLDAIETILRVFRKNQKPFGGVQVLFIGDLFQLPPVVKEGMEKEMLDRHYRSPFFFDAKVLEKTSLVFIELKKIYRQNEQSFIDLLNKLRHNELEEDDYIKLNKRYDPTFISKGSNYITLTTHNHKADVINTNELQKLTSPQYEFKGEVKGEFNEKQLPTEMHLQLKEGAQVMFIKNDSSLEKRYYNGKIVVISKISGDEVYVRFPDTNEELLVERESWENVTYALNKDSNSIDEKVLGEFIQFPLRLAWAITIHKSQGLTFEKAIIDAGDSFAPGQVYVALSRCTSLEGVVLHSRITERALHTDDRIANFNIFEQKEAALQQQLQQEQFKYQTEKLISLFNWKKIVEAFYAFEEATLLSKTIPEHELAIHLASNLLAKSKEQGEIAMKFTNQLDSLLNDVVFTKNTAALKDRIQKGIGYFIKSLHEELIIPLYNFSETLNGKSKLKKYITAIIETDAACWHKITELQHCSFDEEKLCAAELIPTRQTITAKAEKEVGSSAKESLVYFVAGKSIAEIAKIKGLAKSTIEGHLADYVKTGELEIIRFMSLEQVEIIKDAYLQTEEKSTSFLREALKHEYSYSELRLAINHLYFTKQI